MQNETAVEGEQKKFHGDVHGKIEYLWGVIDRILIHDFKDVGHLSSEVDYALVRACFPYFHWALSAPSAPSLGPIGPII